MTRTRKRKKNKNTFLQLFVLFIVIAIVTIVVLEYIDFKKGEKSVIFTKIIPLKKVDSKIIQFNTQLIDILNKNKIPHDYFLDEENKYHFKLDIDQARFAGLIAKVKIITDLVKGKLELREIQGLAGKSIMLYEVKLGPKVTHLLLISKLRPVAKAREPGKKPVEKVKPKEQPKVKVTHPTRIAFIIDDIGEYDIGALELKRLKIPITASVLPDSHRAHEVVRWLKEYRIKTMIHLPMQPTNSNGRRYDPGKVITLGSTDRQIRSLIRRAKQIVPTAEGLNNHEGSLITANRQIMTRVLKIIKEEGLFFVDSRTIGGTVAYEVAKELNINAAYKDVFLDHIPTYSHSIAQVRKLVDIALQKGRAIAIGHPLQSTLRAIKDSERYIKQKGVKIVYVKELLE
ncbi:MAG: divergent polysaccharide deacetylase family protein [Candidatus Aminicenantes bacterium]|nr:MAG: divergent polysaccharide deacetylase family protein [Candidatus Aminicenantes bacterium]